MARLTTGIRGCLSTLRAPGLTAKAVIALALCSTVRLLIAQAPPADTPVREEVDGNGVKYQVPSELLTKSRTQEQKYRSAIRQILGGTASLNADASSRRNFRNYFLQYLFPLWTTEEGLKNVASDRVNFLRDLQNHKNPEAHTELINLTLPAMRRIVEDPAYRLATRYNAMLVISSLNDQEPNNTVVPQTLPEPMQLALPVIYQQFRKADNHDSLRIAALIGLSRHLEWDNYKDQNRPRIPPAARTEILKELTMLADAKEPPEGRDAQVHNWMRRRAIEALANACLTTPDPGIVTTMEKLVKDDSEAVNIRTTAVHMFGRMSLQPPVKVDLAALAKDLGYVALVACDAEVTNAESQRKTEAEREARLTGTYVGDLDATGTGMGMGSGLGGPGLMSGDGGTGFARPIRPQPGMGGDSGLGGDYGIGGMTDPSLMDPRQYQVEYLRRKIRQHLFSVQQGLVGNDDHAPPRTTGGPAGAATASKAGAADPGGPAADKRGLYNLAKSKAERDSVDAVYYKVRRLAEIIEVAGKDAEFNLLLKDIRKELQPLEAVTKRLPPAGAAPADALAEDVPNIPGMVPKAGQKAGGGKTTPKGAAPPKGGPVKAAPPAVKGKTAVRPRPQPPVFGRK